MRLGGLRISGPPTLGLRVADRGSGPCVNEPPTQCQGAAYTDTMDANDLAKLDGVLEHVVNTHPVTARDKRGATASVARSEIAVAESQLAERGHVEPALLASIKGYARSALTECKCEKCGREFGLLHERDYGNLMRIHRWRRSRASTSAYFTAATARIKALRAGLAAAPRRELS